MTRLAGCLLSLVLLVLPACGAPPPAPGPIPEPSIPDRYGAPEVENPRDVRPFAANPCIGLVSSAQLQGLGLASTGRQRTTVLDEPECTWGAGTIDQMTRILLVPDRDALVDTYRARLLPIFEPTTIGGLPAVRQQSAPASADCRLTIGTADGQGLILSYDVFGTSASEQPKDPCGRALRLAEHAVANLPPLTKN